MPIICADAAEPSAEYPTAAQGAAVNSEAMVDRHQALEDVLGSARAEGAEPSPEMRELLERWADGELDTEQLDELAKRAAAGLPLTPPRAA